MRGELQDIGISAVYPSNDPKGVGAWAADHESLRGYGAAGWRNGGDKHNRRVLEAARLYADVIDGRIDPFLLKEAIYPRHEFAVQELMRAYPGIYGDPGGRHLGLRETMSVTDYQALFVDVLDRMYYGYYNAYPIANKALVRINPLRDFRLVSRYLLDGVVQPLTKMDAAAPPPQRALIGPNPQDGSPATTTAPLQYQPYLWQAMTSVNWRAFVNDDLGIFKDLSNRLAIAANRGINKFITGLYLQSSGLNTALYSVGYKNIINVANGASSNNPALSTQAMIDALNVLSAMLDSTGDPIYITGRIKFWYPPQLQGTANNIMNAFSVYVQNQGGVGNTQGFPTQFLNAKPWMIQNMDPVMDPYIPIVNTTSGKTCWGLTVDPDTQERPSIEVGFLNGFETPILYQKLPNTQRMGGGVDAMMGDFYSMDNDMKIVTVFGGTQIDGRSTVASTGLGV